MYPFMSGRPRAMPSRISTTFRPPLRSLRQQLYIRSVCGEPASQVQAQPLPDEGQIEPAAVVRIDLVDAVEQTQHRVRSDLAAEELPEPLLRSLHQAHAHHRQIRPPAAPRRFDIEIPIALQP